MKEQYQVLFQRVCDKEENRWLNGGLCYGFDSYFDTLDEAINCRDVILEKEKCKSNVISMNGIGVEIEMTDKERSKFKLVNIKIRKRQVTEWEELN